MTLWDTLLIPDQTREQLHRDAASERPTHAWLFTGATGAPHREAAKVFAATLLCAGARMRCVQGVRDRDE